jgi:PAS domain S-box-containing protein
MNETLTSAVLVHQPDTTITQCRYNTLTLLKHSASQLIGKKLTDLDLFFIREDGTQLPVEEHPVSLAIKKQRRLNGMIVGIYSDVPTSLTWAQVKAQPDFDSEGNLHQITVSYSDVTDILEKKLAKSLPSKFKDEWEQTFDALQDVVTILSPDYRIIRANKASYTTLGHEANDLVGKYCYEIFHNNPSPCDRCPVRQSVEEAAPKTGLVYNSFVDKTFEVSSSPVLDDDGNVKFLVHTARDFTQKLKDESERMILSAAIDQTTESVIITDINGIIQYVNPSLTGTSGYSREEIVGQDLRFLNHYDHSDSFFEKMWETLHQGVVWKGRLINRKKDGSLFEENATISPIFDNHGKITNYVAVKRDVTKEELLERQLQQALKMESVGTLAGGIAHDFNNILSVMIGFSQVAKSRLSEDDPLMGDIKEILTAGDRAANLVKQILTFSRRDNKSSFKPLRVDHIAKEVLKLLRSSLPTTIKLQHNIDNKQGTILADPGQIHQVIMNLCTNAKQAIGGKYGTITLELREIEVIEPQVMAGSSLLASGPYLELMVKDTGPGMSSEVQKNIFDPFFTTKPKDQGTGLGLSVVHGIVKKHGGEISVESLLNQGTAFHVYFPIINEEASLEAETQEPDYGGTEHIMVVDDEVVITRVMRRMLTKMGYKITTYTDSLLAVKDFRDNPHDYDAVITDMTMPNMTGAKLAQELLSQRPELPIIMTTGYSEVIDKDKATRIGIMAFMLKPVKKKQLSKAIRKVLDDDRMSK